MSCLDFNLHDTVFPTQHHFVLLHKKKKITNCIKLPGYSQSPWGNFARISIFPYRRTKRSFVVKRADITGGRML